MDEHKKNEVVTQLDSLQEVIKALFEEKQGRWATMSDEEKVEWMRRWAEVTISTLTISETGVRVAGQALTKLEGELNSEEAKQRFEEVAAGLGHTAEDFKRILVKVLDFKSLLPAVKAPGRLSPATLPQPAFAEMRAAGTALADGPSGRRWKPIAGELALMHTVEGRSLQTRFRAQASLNWWGLPPKLESLLAELKAGGVPATLAFHAIVAVVVQNDGRIYTTLDDLLRLVGWGDEARRSSAKRVALRRDLWLLLLLCSELEVIGARRGKYRDPLTKKVIDTQSEDPLIVVRGKDAAPQMSLDGISEPPVAVDLVAGTWLERYLGNRQMLSDFGDMLKLAAIPAGQPSGAWAQAMGLALHQLWREESSDAELTKPGATGLSVKYRPFTRRELLDLYKPAPSVEEILKSNDPQRALRYEQEAVKKLKRSRIIGHYRELTTTVKPGRGIGAGDWRNAWLDQPLDIRPTKPGIEATAEILGAAKKARKARASRKQTRKPKNNGS